MPGLGPLGRPDRRQLPLRGQRMNRQMSRHRQVLALLHRPEPAAGPRVQALAIRAHPVHEQGLKLVGVHVPGQAEGGRPPACPLARWLPGRLLLTMHVGFI